VFQPTGVNDLRGRRVGCFGLGVEGRATVEALSGIAGELILVDDADLPGVLRTNDGGLAALTTCEVVLKSPGIPRRRSDILALEASGVIVTSMLNLWLHDVDRSRVIAVTGTKGKSTTTSLIAFMLEVLGRPSRALGNLGHPPYEPSLPSDDALIVLEVSSYQCVDLTCAPAIVALTSLGSDHLDWHGDLETYHADKLSLLTQPGPHRNVVAASLATEMSTRAIAADVAPADQSGLSAPLGLLGSHSDENVGLALAVVHVMTGIDQATIAARVRERAEEFSPLPGRLTPLGAEVSSARTIRYVDDGLATNTLSTLAAIAALGDGPLAVIVGGYDRGVDYHPLAIGVATRDNLHFITMGPAGVRIDEALAGEAPRVSRAHAQNMSDAVELARAALPHGGTVVLSPGAPSFDQYRNWLERSEDFGNEVARHLGS
jgi:UDP-N-acetylmuramoylalanine--D-glutamate ligase